MTETETGFAVRALRRLRYFHGQLLGARDLQREQAYLREKIALPVRYLLGYGVVCGLLVEGVGDHHDSAADTTDESAAKTDESAADTTDGKDRRRRARVRITPGLGVDDRGEHIVVRRDCDVDLWEALPPDERTREGREVTTVWVGVAYDEEAVEPTRTVFTSGCSDSSDCEFGWTDERHRVVVTSKQPEPDQRCERCPGADDDRDCEHPVLWLARIDEIDWFRPVRGHRIDMTIRRPFGRRVPTVITGINWIHGHTYTIEEASALLGTHKESGGLRVAFSDDVRTDSLRRGVVDIQVIEGGAGRNADSWFMGGAFQDLPETEYTRGFRYRQTTREVLQDDDRVMITVRAGFLLDRCCRPVDGTHVGGRVPLIDGEGYTPDSCPVPPGGVGPWTSGTGAGGDTFESWFFVREER
ncbi:hypothetical protein [Actinoplanes sp. NBRC 101535]|uniref:hypothetical protein n=1 Tax=Actinoplanes sp. NBRC 101535 TaxID=3032196 RepID=UPI00249FB450|nr:hypothetical protein [Actinoplanes sp. NBRC 101535]GLY05338.1 hypothetical protein Acsp01_57170 [Actinoplanes sp. NBRC 101535]